MTTRTSKTTAFGTLIRRFASDDGAAALEFAMVAMPFFALLFGIMQVSLVMFANQVLQTMVSTGARNIMVGQMKGRTLSDFRKAICDEEKSGGSALFDCSKILLQVKSFATFSAANSYTAGSCFDPEQADPVACFDPGTGDSIVVVRAIYEWPIGLTMETFNDKSVIVATAAFRNEPF